MTHPDKSKIFSIAWEIHNISKINDPDERSVRLFKFIDSHDSREARSIVLRVGRTWLTSMTEEVYLKYGHAFPMYHFTKYDTITENMCMKWIDIVLENDYTVYFIEKEIGNHITPDIERRLNRYKLLGQHQNEDY